MKKFYRSVTDKKIFGVCGGFSEYINVDPLLVRLVWVLCSLCGGFGLLAYILFAIFIPKNETVNQ